MNRDICFAIHQWYNNVWSMNVKNRNTHTHSPLQTHTHTHIRLFVRHTFFCVNYSVLKWSSWKQGQESLIYLNYPEMNIYNKRTQHGNRASDNKKKKKYHKKWQHIFKWCSENLCFFSSSSSLSLSFFLISNFVTFTSYTDEVYIVHSLLVGSRQKTSFSNQSTMSHI